MTLEDWTVASLGGSHQQGATDDCWDVRAVVVSLDSPHATTFASLAAEQPGLTVIGTVSDTASPDFPASIDRIDALTTQMESLGCRSSS